MISSWAESGFSGRCPPLSRLADTGTAEAGQKRLPVAQPSDARVKTGAALDSEGRGRWVVEFS